MKSILPPLRHGLLLTLAGSLAACSSLGDSNETIDYRTVARKTAPLDVPPDLTALSTDARYAPQSGVVSASSLRQPRAAVPAGVTAAGTPTVALSSLGDAHVVREGSRRVLRVGRAPELLWPKVRDFWTEQGFQFTTEEPQTGLLLTDWAENRAKLPQDLIRRTLGRLIDSVYSTGERDRYRIRLERVGELTEIHLRHEGLVEVEAGDSPTRHETRWTLRPSDPELEAEMMARLMVALGAEKAGARAAVDAAAAAPAAAAPAASAAAVAPERARALASQEGAALQLDETLERGWRRLGQALDRTGFTVEERDRALGLYAVRYVDPVISSQEAPGFFARMFGAKDPLKEALGRYRVVIQADGAERCTVRVLTPQGRPDNSASAQRIVQTLVEELKR
ncbi:outer membrane protein assembly factor BamC [Ideonella livida]|uniref:Outer membrane protein assembly factor BamC n=1 Tax=Ideonella livida TaxID=2707176 RepID=A0A7C9THU8_9BURK|nr:outer membrane protein assembly factor BamC [Ideonella livida]NDY89902.1 outer membrane protein assembly factor BamC [Ideonella livida]